MGIETKSKQIGKHTYYVEQFGAKQGGRVLVRVAKMLGTAIGGAVEAGERLDAAVIGKTLSGFTEHLTEADYDYLCDSFSPKTRVSGGDYGEKKPKLADYFDSHFAGEFWEMGQWLAFCFEVNYGSFLAVVLEQTGKLAPKAQALPDSDEVEETAKAS